MVSIQGNHAMLMVPIKNDTIWLECTNQKIPFGQTGSTDDRDVLVISNNIGKIVHTNKYKPSHNYQKTQGSINIDEKGHLQSSLEIQSSGKQYNKHFGIYFKKNDEQIKYYKNKFSDLINLKIDSINLINNKDKIIFKEKLTLRSFNYAEIIGNDMIIKPNIFNVYDYLPKRNKNRIQPLFINFGFLDEDDLIINIPINYQINVLPKPIKIETKFGNYNVSVNKITDTKISYKRLLTINDGEYLKTDYNLFRKFIKEIIKNDKQNIIITKKK